MGWDMRVEKLVDRMQVDGLTVPHYSPSHPRGHMFRKIDSIWEKTGNTTMALVEMARLGAMQWPRR